MTYQVLARKWRPQDFANLVGQEQIVTALRNALTENRIAQAYLFSGIRGVGKTTAARVLAKALNCRQRTSGDPCNACDSCIEIGAGNTMDVIEVDAATYSKVEQVRELTETLRYGPANSRYKVVVLDEVHRLSKQAFDALLKIVEEPPAHLVFIFATTEIDAVPATILSRCQEFQFRRVPSPTLAEHLRTICKAESIEVSDVALRLIARAGEGSVRDSVALLDQMATFGSGKISDDDAKKLLGGLDSAIFQKLLAGILAGQHQPILEVISNIEANGWDPHNIYSQFLSFSRDALHLALGTPSQNVDLPEEECSTLKKTLEPFGYEALLQVLQLLISSEGMVRRSEVGLLALEIAWLRAAELPKIQKLEDILSGRTSLPTSSSGPASPGRLPNAGPVEARSPDLPTRSMRGYEQPKSEVPKSEANRVVSNTESLNVSSPVTNPGPVYKAPVEVSDFDPSRIGAFLEVISTRRQSLAAHLRKTRLSVSGTTLQVQVQKDDTFVQGALDRPRNREAVDQTLLEVWGPGGRWSIDLVASLGPASTQDHQASNHSTSERKQAAAPTRIQEPHPMEPPDEDRFANPTLGATLEQTQVSYQPSHSGAPISTADIKEASDLPTVRSVLEIFGGKIRSVEPQDSQPEEKQSEENTI